MDQLQYELAERPPLLAARSAGEASLKAAFPDADARSLDRLAAIAEENEDNNTVKATFCPSAQCN